MMAATHSLLTGPRLADARRVVGLSQPALARSLGVSALALRRWEQSAAPIPASYLGSIAAALWAARQAQLARDLERFTRLQTASGSTPTRVF